MTTIHHTLIMVIKLPIVLCLLLLMVWNTPLYWQLVELTSVVNKGKLW